MLNLLEYSLKTIYTMDSTDHTGIRGSLPGNYFPGIPRQFHIGFSLRFNNSDRF